MHVVLVTPEIPQNTGSIARLCAGTRTTLHLVEPLGFSLADRYLKRAGLDYWPHVDLAVHPSFDAVERALARHPFRCFSSKASTLYTDVTYGPDDVLIFGRETQGLQRPILERYADSLYWIPIHDAIRSQNLANAVSVVLYEALRQNGWPRIPLRAP